MIRNSILLMFCFLSFSSFSQDGKKIDSLKNELKKNKKDKFQDYKKLTLEFYNSDSSPDEFEKYCKITYSYALTKNNNNYIAVSKTLFALLNNSNQNYSESYKNLKEALFYAIKSNDNNTLARVYYILSRTYFLENKSKEAINNGLTAVSYYKKCELNQENINTLFNIYNSISQCYVAIGLFELAKFNNLKSKEYLQKATNEINYFQYYETLSTINIGLNNLDEAIKVNKECLSETRRKNFRTQNKNGLIYSTLYEIASSYFNESDIKNARVYIDSLKFYQRLLPEGAKNYFEAPTYSLESSILFSEKNILACKKQNDLAKLSAIKNQDLKIEIQSYIISGDIKFELKEYEKAIDIFEKILTNKNLYDFIDFKLEIFKKLSNLYSLTNQPQKSIFHLDNYTKLNEKLFNEKIANSIVSQEIKYETELKESKIKTQQLQIQKEKTKKNLAFAGIGFLIMLSGFGYFWFINKQKQANLKTQNTLLGLQQNLVEAELYSLNKQLDPHEIKNLLASISPEIQEKAPESYKKMLKLFNLTKASLNSNSITDSLQNQLQQIDDFLSLEKSMLTMPLTYTIYNSVQDIQTQIPRLLLKNLVENSIKHGIKHQEIGGAIIVKVEEKDNFICISVDDTGKGINYAIPVDSGIGTTTYQKLFATLNPKNKQNASFEIIDKQQGTKVEMKIPLDYKYV